MAKALTNRIQEAGDIAAWVPHALYETGTNWIRNIHEHNRDSTSGLLQRRNCHAAMLTITSGVSAINSAA